METLSLSLSLRASPLCAQGNAGKVVRKKLVGSAAARAVRKDKRAQNMPSLRVGGDRSRGCVSISRELEKERGRSPWLSLELRYEQNTTRESKNARAGRGKTRPHVARLVVQFKPARFRNDSAFFWEGVFPKHSRARYGPHFVWAYPARSQLSFRNSNEMEKAPTEGEKNQRKGKQAQRKVRAGRLAPTARTRRRRS